MNKEVEPCHVSPENEHAELRNQEADNGEPGNIKSPQSPHSLVPENPSLIENVPEVSTPNAPFNANIWDSSIGYLLPFRHNRGKPPNRYSPDEEERKSKYPIANYVYIQDLSKPLKTFTQALASFHIPNNVEEALSDPKWAEAIQDELEAQRKIILGIWCHYQTEKN